MVGSVSRGFALWAVVAGAVGVGACSRAPLGIGVPPEEGVDAGTPEMDAGPVRPRDAGRDRPVMDAPPAVDAGPPPPPWTGPRFVQLALGASHSCALDEGGVVWCWGGDVNAQLGRGLRHRHECGPSLRRAGP